MEHAQEKPYRKPPSGRMLLATVLELGMLACFAHHRSLLGGFLALVYFPFSASRAYVEELFSD